MKHIFVDFEMNPVESQYKQVRQQCRQEIIEIGAVMLDDTYQEIDSFKQYVKPAFSSEITKKYVQLTGITTQMLEDAPSFHEAIISFLTWCGGQDEDYELYAWSENDLIQLKKECQLKEMVYNEVLDYAIANWHDFQRTFCDLLGLYKPISLETAVSSIGREFTGHMHDALWDARNTAYIYMLSKDTKNFYKKMQPIIDLINPPKDTSCTLGDIFDFSSLGFHAG